jgi:hypothetical protein
MINRYNSNGKEVAMFKTRARIPSALLPLLILTLLAPACTGTSTAVPTPAENEIRAEEQAVYVAVFTEIYGEPRMYVLMDQTSPGIEGVEGLDAAIASILAQFTGLEDATTESFRARNEAAVILPADMDLGLPYVLLTRADFDVIFSQNTSGWDVFYTRYPNSAGMTTVSRVGFNEDFTQALVYVGTMSHWLAGAGYYILLVKSSGTWQVDQQVMAWIS